MKKHELSMAYGILSAASLEKVEVADRITIVRLLRGVRKEAESLGDFINDLREKNQDILKDPKRITELDKAIKEEGNKDVTAVSKVLSKETFSKLLESNPQWTPAQIMLIEDVFIVKSKE